MEPHRRYSHQMLSLAAAALALGSGSVAKYLGHKANTAPEEKPCLVCGKPKQHNNAFCSAECCKKHKSSKKA